MLKRHFKAEENNYNEANSQYNEFNLKVTKQQSKISALKQELEFKNNQLNDLQYRLKPILLHLLKPLENITEFSTNH